MWHFVFTPVQHDPDFTEINLSLRPGRVFLRNEDFNPAAGFHIDLRPADPARNPAPSNTTDPALRAPRQPGEDPAGRMTLLPRRCRVLDQHGVDRGLERLQPPRHTPPWFPFWRGGRFQGLPHRSSVNTMPGRQRTNRQALYPGVPSDLCEQLHSRLHPDQPSVESIH